MKLTAGIFSIALAIQQLGYYTVLADDRQEQQQPDGHCAFQVNEGTGQDAKIGQMAEFTINPATSEFETTNFGQRVNNSESLKAGLRGPTLMEDFMLREKIMHFGNDTTYSEWHATVNSKSLIY